MNRSRKLRDHLPSLWRPEPGDDSLLSEFLDGIGDTLDDAGEQLQHVLRARWSRVADAAAFDAHYVLERRDRGRPPVNPRDAEDAAELDTYPYVDDLARLAALLKMPPWREPGSLAEGVEEYRQRIRDLLGAYRTGLVTLPALRRVIEAALPEDMGAAVAARRWPFSVEEPVGFSRRRQSIRVPQASAKWAQPGYRLHRHGKEPHRDRWRRESPEAGAEEDTSAFDQLPPLHYWRPREDYGSPTVLIQGLAEDAVHQPPRHTPAAAPLIERYTPGAALAGVGIGWRGTLAADEVLRLQPAQRSWLLVDDGLHASPEPAAGNLDADPAANGPWTAVGGAPADTARALAVAGDGSLWLLGESAGAPALLRHDGHGFEIVTEGGPAGEWLCLHAHASGIYLGTSDGLYRTPLVPARRQPWRLRRVPNVRAPVHAIRDDGAGLACACDDGLALLDAEGTLLSRELPGLPLRALVRDRDRLWVATASALLQRVGSRWYRYEGSALGEQTPDWLPIEADAEADAAAAAQSPLPPINDLLRTADGSLWLATEAGLARYRVRDARTTLLEAFPDVTPGAVRRLRPDGRGLLWIAGAHGLLRFDGQALAQFDFAAGHWAPLGAADERYPDAVATQARGHWRYTEDTGWQVYDSRAGRFASAAVASRALPSPALADALATPAVVAERGALDDGRFTAHAAVPQAELVMRIKPGEDRIVDGGLPFIPEHRPGAVWRYLQIEPEDLSPPRGRPWWSCEGRLHPAPQAPAPPPGRFRAVPVADYPDALLSQAAFSYPPSARLWVEHAHGAEIGIRVRLLRRRGEPAPDPALVERVWTLLRRCRPAGVPLQLCFEGQFLKGEAP